MCPPGAMSHDESSSHIKICFIRPMRVRYISTENMAALRCVFFVSLFSSCLGASYVIFPMFTRSHYLVIAKVGEELAARGHKVS